jgi:hypothetical protein
MVEDDIVVVENVNVIDDKFDCDANAQTWLSTFQMLDISHVIMWQWLIKKWWSTFCNYKSSNLEMENT